MALTVAVTLLALLPAGAQAARLDGVVVSGKLALAGTPVELRATRAGGRPPALLASSATGADGTFSLRYRPPRRAASVLYVTAGRGDVVRARPPKGAEPVAGAADAGGERARVAMGAPTAGAARVVGIVRLAAALGTAPVRRPVVVNERTTVAAGFALAAFLRRGAVSGSAPGPQNAARMAQNLADLRSGRAARVLRRAPNGRRTSTLRRFNSLANLVARCARGRGCRRFLSLAHEPGLRRMPRGTLQALANVAQNPWQNVRALLRLARTGPHPYRPALKPSQQIDSWTLPVRFVGDGHTMNGPGNLAFDAAGNAYVLNNYEYSRRRLQPVCGSGLLLKFTPDGRFAPGSPFEGGGLSGAGYGITFDPDGNVWAGNFGFAGRGCEVQPPHDSVSKLTPSGRALSPPVGFTAGDISWPQGTVSDRDGNIWIANCGNDSVTVYPDGDPARARNLSDVGVVRPFDVAINARGQALVTSNNNDSVVILNPDGAPARSPITGLGIVRPMGIAVDSRGNAWVASSHVIDPPCPGATPPPEPSTGGSVALIGADGTPRTPPSGFTGGGMTVPWGISLDGDDNVWVGNFAGRRVTQICGTRPARCPPGVGTGEPISPDGTGYGFDGLTRTTGLQPDTAGNVWVTNNWKQVPLQTNPGGYELVVFVGIAAPLRTPVIGPPRPL